jgi:hypothetical protein
MLWGALPSGANLIEENYMTDQLTFIVSEDQLRTNPLVQAAAAAYMSVDVAYTLEQEDADVFSDKATQAITNCCAAMGEIEDSPLGDVVGEVIREMSDKMRLALVNAGTLRSDCAEAWQAQVA